MQEGIQKCKNCGAALDISKAVNGVIECEYCSSLFTVPKKEVSPAALSFLRQGEHDLDTCEFDKAYAAYAKAAEYDEKEPEAYWGMALAEFKVQYIKDKVNNRLQSICHEFTDKIFKENRNYLKALSFATDNQRELYGRKAEEIDYIRNEFLALKQSGLDYDCFICVKISRLDNEQTDNSKKNWTDDAYNADAIYDLLKRNGYSPFFSEREVRGQTGAQYEARILYALYTSETMLVVCSNEEYLKTPWVKNEYTRFKELVNNREKENDSITIVFNGTPIERLPGTNHGKIQGIDYSRKEAVFEIVKFVEEHTPLARAKREEEKRNREQAAKEILEIKERLKNLNPNAAVGATSTVGTLLTRANQEMEAKNFDKASKFFETVLERAPENAAAWWGLFLVEFSTLDEKFILTNFNQDTIVKIIKSNNFANAIKYADGSFRERIGAFKNSAKCKLNNSIDALNATINQSRAQKAAIEKEVQKQKTEYGAEISNKQNYVNQCVDKQEVCNKHNTKTKAYFSFRIFSPLFIFSGIFIILALTGVLLYLHFTDKAFDEKFPVWLVWGSCWGGPAEEGWFLNHILAVIGCLLEGIVYGIVVTFAINLVIAFLRIFFMIPYNIQAKKRKIALDAAQQETQNAQAQLSELTLKSQTYFSQQDNCIINLNNAISAAEAQKNLRQKCLELM